MKILSLMFLLSFMTLSFSSCAQNKKKKTPAVPAKNLAKYSRATFASGCFWCVEAAFESVKGVEEVISGYSGDKSPNPTYESVSAHTNKHAEAIEVYYDSTIVSYNTLLKVYFGSQNPTQVNGQGPDHGSSYRSLIFYRSLSEKNQAIKYKSEIQKNYSRPVAAEIVPFEKFWPAEDYHQDYIKHNPDVPYVQGESMPRIRRFQKQFPELIKPDKRY